MAAESPKQRIIVQRNLTESQVAELGIESWPKWGCPPGRYQLKYDEKETCNFVRGRIKVYTKGLPETEVVEFGAGDLVILPKGLSCTWDVSIAVDKYYKFDSSSSSSSSSSLHHD